MTSPSDLDTPTPETSWPFGSVERNESLTTIGLNFYDSITEITWLPASLTTLDLIGCSKLEKVCALPVNLKRFIGSGTSLKTLPPLPETLETLTMYASRLKSLPNLPQRLKILHVGCSDITKLPELPASLEILQCHDTALTVLPPLPRLLSLMCQGCRLRSLPPLPDSLDTLRADRNPFDLGIDPEEVPVDFKDSPEFVSAYERWTLLKEKSRNSLETVFGQIKATPWKGSKSLQGLLD